MTYFDATSNLNFLLFSLNKGLFSIWGKGKIDMLKALVQWLLLDTKNKGGYTATNEKNIITSLDKFSATYSSCICERIVSSPILDTFKANTNPISRFIAQFEKSVTYFWGGKMV